MTDQLLPSGAIVVPVGSRVTCSPAPTGTDEDYLVLVKDRDAAVQALKAFGFEHSADPEKVVEYVKMNETSQYRFTSLFLGHVNYIITDSEFFFERFLTATHVCKSLNLLNKADRVMVFEAIRGASFYREMATGWEPALGEWFDHKKTGGRVSDAWSEALMGNTIGNLQTLPF